MTLVFEYSSHSVSSLAGLAGVFEARVAEGAEERELAVPRHRDLGARIAALGDVPRDDLDEALERLRIEAERRRMDG